MIIINTDYFSDVGVLNCRTADDDYFNFVANFVFKSNLSRQKLAHHMFPDPEVTSSDCLCCSKIFN